MEISIIFFVKFRLLYWNNVIWTKAHHTHIVSVICDWGKSLIDNFIDINLPLRVLCDWSIPRVQ